MKHSYAAALLACSIALLAACGRPGVPPDTSTISPDAPTRAATPAAPPLTPGVVLPSTRIVGYYPSWAPGRGLMPAGIAAEKLTHINYAFSNVSEAGECILGDPAADLARRFSAGESVSGVADPQGTQQGGMRGNFNQLRLLKQKHPHLQVLISVGGWTWSGEFSDAALSEESRQRFARSCIDLYLKQNAGVFDGIDIDWEYPAGGGLSPGRPEDKKNFTLLLAEFRRQLDALGKAEGRHYLLTIAAPAGPGPAGNIERSEIVNSLDWINLMTYDLHGTWESTTNFNAPLFQATEDPASPALNVDAAVLGYLNAGVPAERLVLGVPFYGKGWEGVAAVNGGLYQAARGPAPGKWEPGSFDYKDLKQRYLSEPAYTRGWSVDARVPWLFNPETGIFITYDDPDSLSAKAGYVVDHGLGGVMIWELSQDDGSLLEALYARLNPGPAAVYTPTPALAGAARPESGHVAGAPRPFEKEIGPVEAIAIDGRLDDWPAAPDFTFDQDSQIVYRLQPGNWNGPQDFSARAWAGWAADGLYFAFEVTDDRHIQDWSGPSLWQGDYMELQIDTRLDDDYDDTAMSDDDYQLGFSPGDFASVLPEAAVWFGPVEAAQVKLIRQAQTRAGEGYVMEVFLPIGLLQGLRLEAGAAFGMNVNPSDTDHAGQPQKLMMSTSPIRTLSDPTTFGKIVLVN
jgi:chitinase